jgi:hypothetical protein
MGNTESHDESSDLEKISEQKNINHKFFFDKYNWTPSLPGFEYDTITETMLKRKFNLESTFIAQDYVDLRNNFPQILSINTLPFNPIISVVYLLHYQLLKNKLPIFPPSALYIYKHISFYKNIKSLFSFEIIFEAIKKFGFCSENELRTLESNINNVIPNKLIEKSTAFKFIQIYKIEQKLENIKTILQNEYPILIGFTVYYDLSSIDSYMWLPDKSEDKKLGGLTGVLVGYIEERKMFIMASTFGKYFGNNGYIMVPYEYVTSSKYTGELYTLDFKRERVEGYINQRKEMINLQNNVEIKVQNKKVYEIDTFGNLFT